MSVQKTLILAIALLLVVSAGATAASKRINWTGTGAALGTPVEGIASTYPDCGRLMLIHVHVKGSPGSADIFGFNLACPDDRAENSLVARFKDGSLLNFISDGNPPDVGFDPDTGFVIIRFSLIVSSGFGRFNGASGEVDAVLHVKPVAPGSLLQYEYGTLTGNIQY